MKRRPSVLIITILSTLIRSAVCIETFDPSDSESASLAGILQNVLCSVVAVDMHRLGTPDEKFFLCDGFYNSETTYHLNVDPSSKLAIILNATAPKVVYVTFPPNVTRYEGVNQIPTVDVFPENSQVMMIHDRDVEALLLFAAGQGIYGVRKLRRRVVNVKAVTLHHHSREPSIISSYSQHQQNGGDKQSIDKPPAVASRYLVRQNERNLRVAKGNKSALIVLVSTQDTVPLRNETSARQEFSRAARQFQVCSGGNFVLSLNNTVKVTLGRNVSQYNALSVYFAAKSAVNHYYGFAQNKDPASELNIDHILYHVPIGLYGEQSVHGVAFSAIGGTFSVFQHEMFKDTVLLHEIAHNYNLHHARESLPTNPDSDASEDPEYGDDSGIMGSSFITGQNIGTRRCFNGANFFDLGWYTVESESAELRAEGDYLAVTIASFTNIPALQSGLKVYVKVEDYFITYNERYGSNYDTSEYFNKIIVVKKMKDGGTELKAVLAPSSHEGQTKFVFQPSNLTIEVCGEYFNQIQLIIGLGIGCDQVSSTALRRFVTSDSATKERYDEFDENENHDAEYDEDGRDDKEEQQVYTVEDSDRDSYDNHDDSRR